jgi:hypothetical protein
MTVPGTIIGGGSQGAARIACEFCVNRRRDGAAHGQLPPVFRIGMQGCCGLELRGVDANAEAFNDAGIESAAQGGTREVWYPVRAHARGVFQPFAHDLLVLRRTYLAVVRDQVLAGIVSRRRSEEVSSVCLVEMKFP